MNIDKYQDRIELLEDALRNIFLNRQRDSIYGDMLPVWSIDSENFEDFINEMANL